MSIFSRKKDSAAAQIQNARLELDGVNATIADRRKRREVALLAATDDFTEVTKLDGELDGLESTARLWGDKIELLEQQARREDAEAVARRKEAHIERIEAKLAERDQAGAELQELIEKADQAFRRVLSLSEQAMVAWPFATTNLNPAALGDASITALLKHELYRVGARPFIGGVPGAKAEPQFPGGAPPTNEARGLPQNIRPLSAALKEASDYASRVMRGQA